MLHDVEGTGIVVPVNAYHIPDSGRIADPIFLLCLARSAIRNPPPTAVKFKLLTWLLSGRAGGAGLLLAVVGRSADCDIDMPVVIKSKGFRRMVRLAKEAADHDFGFSLRDQLFVLRHGPAVDGLGVGYPEIPVVDLHAGLP